MELHLFTASLAAVVRREINTRGITTRTLADRTGIPHVTLHRRLTGTASSFTAVEVVMIGNVLGIAASELVSEAETTALESAS